MGSQGVLGNEGRLENHCNQAPCSPSSRLFIHFSHTTPIVGSLTVKSPERQIVGVLIVRFLEYQQRNVNLQNGSSDGGG